MCKSLDNRRHKGSYEQGFVLVLCQDLVIGFETVPAEHNRKKGKKTVEAQEKKIHILISLWNRPYAESCGEDYGKCFSQPFSY